VALRRLGILCTISSLSPQVAVDETKAVVND
jgi:hypothetical protein